MIDRDAVALVLEAFPDAIFICANGYISREVFNTDDRPGNFYMLGSMGLGSSIGLGAALSQPEKTVVVLDGDGNTLMGLGAMTLVSSQAPRNLLHVCLDNGVYASTGNQPTVSPKVSLEGIALAAGYTHAARAETPEQARAALRELAETQGPAFLRILIETQAHPRDFPRVSHTPVEIRDRFQGALRA